MNIPASIKNDNFTRVYTVRDINDNITFQATRQPSPDDKEAVKFGSMIRVPAQYFGEWQDTTEQAIAEQEAIKESKEKKPKTSPKLEKAKEDVKAQKQRELEKAEELLKVLRGE